MEKNRTEIALSLEEEVEMIFRKFDSNGDGRISLKELGAMLNALGSSTPVDEVSRIMLELDTDGNGTIDLKEFKAFHCGGGAAVDDGEMREAFDMYDRDKNGKISVSELDKCSIKDCRRMIKSVDVDGDGCVNFEEFKKMMTRSST